MTLTVRSATVLGATTKGSALSHAEMDENWNHVANFLQSGSGATTRTVQDVERAIVRSGDYALTANYEARRDALTETIGVANLDLPATTSSTGIIYVDLTRFLHKYGTSNTFLGESSGNFTMTSTSCTAVGRDTLSSLTSGINNTAIGSGAMNLITTGEDSVAIGTLAVNTSTTGPRWTVAIGHAAGRTITNPDYLTAVGYQAAETGGSGVRNTALGAKALRTFTTGTDNIGVGFEAGTLIEDGTGNVAMGSFALAAAVSATNCTVIGHIAGQDTTGNANTFVGRSAGTDYTSGTQNVLLGYQAGHATIGGNPARTGSNNVAVGANSGGTSAAVSNSVCIGEGATVGFGSSIAIGRGATASVSTGLVTKIGNGYADACLSGRLHFTNIVSAVASDTGVTYTTAQFRGGLILRTGAPGGGFNDTTPTAAALEALIGGAEVGTGYDLYIHNTTGQTMTLLAGNGITLAGTTTVATGQTRLYKVVFTNVTASSEAATVYGVFTAAN